MLVIGRFLALLELYRDGSVAFEQVAPLGDLTIRWIGSDDGTVDVQDEYDDQDDAAIEVEAAVEADAAVEVDAVIAGERETQA